MSSSSSIGSSSDNFSSKQSSSVLGFFLFGLPNLIFVVVAFSGCIVGISVVYSSVSTVLVAVTSVLFDSEDTNVVFIVLDFYLRLTVRIGDLPTRGGL